MEMNVKRQKKDKYIDRIVFGVLFVAASGVMLTLFHRQTLGGPSTGYHSDMNAYILEMLGLDSGYSFPYPILFKLGALIHLFTGPQWAMALATMLLNSLAILLTKLALNRLTLKSLAEAMPRCSWAAGILVSVVSVSLFFLSMVYPPSGIYLPGIKFHYIGVFSPNPFHNATYMAARPFAILAFLWYVKLLDKYEEGYGGKWRQSQKGVDLCDYFLFTLFLLLSTMTKPSFTIVLVGAAGLIMVYRMIKSRFRNFLPTIQLGFCFMPTFLDLLYQFKGVFVPEEGAEGGIGFCFGEVWRLYCDNIPLAIGLAAGFPILVLLLHYKELKQNTLYRFSWQIYIMSFLMAFLLYEKGFRKPDFNFSWGYMYGIFFVFFSSLIVLIRDTARKKKPLLLGLQWAAFLWHVVCGLYYFLGIFRGQMYY